MYVKIPVSSPPLSKEFFYQLLVTRCLAEIRTASTTKYIFCDFLGSSITRILSGSENIYVLTVQDPSQVTYTNKAPTTSDEVPASEHGDDSLDDMLIQKNGSPVLTAAISCDCYGSNLIIGTYCSNCEIL